jgi:hypothetical protein
MQRLLDTIVILARVPAKPRIGSRVRVTKSAYTLAAPVGTIGRLIHIGKDDDGHPCLTITREDNGHVGWCEQAVAID